MVHVLGCENVAMLLHSLFLYLYPNKSSNMQVLLFFGSYLGLLLIASFAILGWYAITRGNWVDYPDGTRKKGGKIFKGWWFFWMREHKKPIVKYYTGERLLSILHDIKAISGAVQVKTIWPNSVTILLSMTEIQISDLQVKAKRGLGVEVDFSELKESVSFDEDETRSVLKTTSLSMVVSEQYPNYVYPDWVRDVMAGCITCHASIYGSIAFWAFHCLVRQYDFHHTIYGWVSPTFVYPTIVLTWIAFCFSLSYLLTVLWKKF